MAMQELVARGSQVMMKNVGRQPVVFVKGLGSRVWDADGKEYIDLLTGISVDSLGHSHPEVVAAWKKQAEKIMHVSNLFWLEEQILAAERLTSIAGMDRVFWSNSGAEANEAAIKLARKYGKEHGGRYRIISALNSFHGRTLGALAMTGKPKYQESFQPMPDGFDYAPYNDLTAWEEMITPETCGLMVEPVQGEGGVYPASPEFLKGLRRLCDQHDLLLIYDEIQTGFGRAGAFFAWQRYDVLPDVMTTAKTLGCGIPIGALMARGEAAEVLTPGDHSTTVGGGGMAYAAALVAMEVIERDGLAQRSKELGAELLSTFNGWKESIPIIQEVRGLGLFIAIELSVPSAPVVQECLKRGVIVNAVTENAIRLLPALNISEKDLDEGLKIVKEVLQRAMK